MPRTYTISKNGLFIFYLEIVNISEMATVKQLQDLKKNFEKQIDKLIASAPTETADAAGEDTEAEPETDVKLTPIQKLEKQKETANEKLTKLNEKIAGGKSKIPDKDEENKAKFEEVISKINAKIAEIQSKEAKKAEPKPAKAAAKKAEEAEPAPAKAKAKVVEKTTETEAKTEVKKHVPRMTPAITVILKEAFKTVSVEWDDKYKSEFTKWVNALSEKEFDEMKLEGHASTFANAQSPPAAGGGAAVVKALKVSDLQKQAKNLVQASVGVYRHKTTGEMVTGPAEDSDEEFEEATVDGVDYVIGQTTKRVYKTSEGPDEFVGYWGVGEFYEANL